MVTRPARRGDDSKIIEILCKRDFLNLPYNHSDGSIMSQVSIFKGDSWAEVNTTVKIRDCDRAISLSFPLYDEYDYKNNMYKISTLINNLNSLRDGLEKAYIEFNRIKKEQDEKAERQIYSDTEPQLRGNLERATEI